MQLTPPSFVYQRGGGEVADDALLIFGSPHYELPHTKLWRSRREIVVGGNAFSHTYYTLPLYDCAPYMRSTRGAGTGGISQALRPVQPLGRRCNAAVLTNDCVTQPFLPHEKNTRGDKVTDFSSRNRERTLAENAEILGNHEGG